MAACSRRSTGSPSQHKAAWTKVLLIAAVGGMIAAAKRFGPPKQGIDWEKRLERMPESAPPKWMFNNIKAIRQNTDRILELLEHRQPDTATSEAVGT